MHDQLLLAFVLREAHLCDSFHGACGEIRRGEGEATVGASIERLEVKGHLLFPLVALAQVNAVHPHEPVGTGNHLHHQGQLWIRERENGVQNLCGLHLSSTEFCWTCWDALMSLSWIDSVRTELLSKQQRQRDLCFCKLNYTHEPDSSSSSKCLFLHFMLQLQSSSSK